MKVKECTLIKALVAKEDTPIVDVAIVLKQNKQRRIIIVDKNEFPIGILSTTDMNNKVVADLRDMKKTKAKDVMASPIFLVCDIEDDLGELYSKMHDHTTYFVPVTKAKKIHGILTYGELMHRVKEAIKHG